ncbi:hypothetical protein WG908_14210 [Sphingobium sp. AN641]|uniref:hypothetical protein n=1 Tax=Sphingobium sp. AN641 TaxID=3133443 RepID=UPI0030C22251
MSEDQIIGRSADRAAMAHRFVDRARVCAYDIQAASIRARIPCGRGSFDRRIAAQAVAHNLGLVTDEDGDFAATAGLRVENWTL